jgi:hypothetical protein
LVGGLVERSVVDVYIERDIVERRIVRADDSDDPFDCLRDCDPFDSRNVEGVRSTAPCRVPL